MRHWFFKYQTATQFDKWDRFLNWITACLFGLWHNRTLLKTYSKQEWCISCGKKFPLKKKT